MTNAYLRRWHFVVFFLLLAAAGCANLTARKVPVAARVNDADECVRGFRYYLSRPHLVVSRSTQLAQFHDFGQLVRRHRLGNQPEYAIECVGESGTKTYYNLGGHRLPSEKGAASWTLATDLSEFEKTKASGGTNLDNSLPRGAVKRATAASDEELSTIQVVFLPDFEEQMAVKQVNFLAHGKFAMNFSDGWQLQSLNGSFDSTEVAVQVLNTIRNAIGAAAKVADSQIRTRAGAPLAGGDRGFSGAKSASRVLITHTLYLDPGIYKLTRANERCGAPTDGPIGILTDLGIPVKEDLAVSLLAEPKPEHAQAPSCATPAAPGPAAPTSTDPTPGRGADDTPETSGEQPAAPKKAKPKSSSTSNIELNYATDSNDEAMLSDEDDGSGPELTPAEVPLSVRRRSRLIEE